VKIHDYGPQHNVATGTSPVIAIRATGTALPELIVAGVEAHLLGLEALDDAPHT
jgi:hypothetical protein